MATQSTVVLKMLQEKAINTVNLAQDDFVVALKSVDEAKTKESMLIDYKKGYIDSLKQSLESGLNIESYQNYQNFLVKLDEAIEGQQGVVKMAEQTLKLKRSVLQMAQKKKLSYDVLLQRADKRQSKAEQIRDQKMMDEYAMRASRPK